MAWNPCCMPLQRGVKILAIIDMVLCVLRLLSVSILLGVVFGAADAFDNYHPDDRDLAKKVLIGISVVMLVTGVLWLILSIILYSGANRRNYRRCLVWLVITIIITLLMSAGVIITAATNFNGATFALGFISVLYAVYEIVVVNAFMNELNDAGGCA